MTGKNELIWEGRRQVHDHLLLVHLFAAYLNCIPTVTLSYGNMKFLFWNCAQVNATFADSIFNVKDPAVALSTVTINIFLLRAIQQWVLFLCADNTIQQWVPIIEHMCPIFERLEFIVHPAFDFCIVALSAMVNFCSHAYRTAVVSEHLLHRQVSRACEVVDSGLDIALADAFVFQQSYFPTAASFLLLERTILFVKRRKSKIEILIDCNLSWARLLTKLFTSPESTCVSWPSSQLADFLFSLKPNAFDNAELTLRFRYPRLLKGPGTLLREFLSHNVTVRRCIWNLET